MAGTHWIVTEQNEQTPFFKSFYREQYVHMWELRLILVLKNYIFYSCLRIIVNYHRKLAHLYKILKITHTYIILK